jgi:hypothetical protein
MIRPERQCIWALLISGFFSGMLNAAETALIFDGSLGYQYGRSTSSLGSGSYSDGTSGWAGAMYVSPLVVWKAPGLVFSPSWDFRYDGAASPLKVEEKQFLFRNQTSNTLNLGGSWVPKNDDKFKAYAVYASFNGAQSADETWMRDGLYDYQDLGAWAGWQRRWGFAPMKTELGYRFTDRRYPHYVSLSDGRHEKDSRNHTLYADADFILTENPSRIVSLGYSFQRQNYLQALVIDATGTTGGASQRHDDIHLFNISLPISRQALQSEMGYTLERRVSNEAFLDTDTGDYFPHYNSYLEHGFFLNLGYQFKDAWMFMKPQLSLAGSFGWRQWDERPRRNADGESLGNVENDNTYKASLTYSSFITQRFGVFVGAQYSHYLSDTQNQQSALSNYEVAGLSAGTQWTY